MKSYDRPSSNASGAAAVRQTQTPDPAGPDENLSPEDRAARVSELRAQYQRGLYRVDAAELSADIVKKHLKE